MKPAPFTYHDPDSIDELVAVLGDVEDAKILAGGQSLMPMLNLRYVMPDHVIDANGIPELSFVDRRNGMLELGAMTRQSTLIADETVRTACPIMQEALCHVGHFQTRNRGTLGGSLCHLDPAAELPAIAALYGASLTVRGPGGTREIAMDSWPLAYMMPNLAPDEALISMALPLWTEPHGHAFLEFARRHGDFAIVAVACLLAIDGAGTIRRAALTVAGTDVHPRRLSEVESALVGQPATAATFAAAAADARKIEARSDAFVSAAYRRRVAGVLVERALAAAAKRATEE